MRLWSGVVMAGYVVPHVMNHALGVFSFEAMDAFQAGYAPFWRTGVGTTLLYSAFLVHFVLTLMALYRRSTLRMPAWEATQIIVGLLLVPLLTAHAVSVRVHHHVYDAPMAYEVLLHALIDTSPWVVVQYAVMATMVWVHLTVGLHFWLRSSARYRRWIPVVRPTAVVILILGLVGLLRASWSVATDPNREASRDEKMGYIFADLERYEAPNNMFMGIAVGVFLVAILGTFVARAVRQRALRRRGIFRVTVPSGRVITSPMGHTVLETLRRARIPHAAVCGGRGRCTTCRVTVRTIDFDLPPPADTERRGLARIGASADVRLACQIRPTGDVEIVPLLPAGATAREANRPGGVRGREQPIVIMFIDLRGSTRLGEERLPYDVLFILNQFFAEMAAALTETGGHYAQFSGDGLMALYGIDEGVRTGARNALEGARVMHKRLDRLNATLADELSEPLRMGVGIHCGDAIVGTMGPPNAPNFSAIGDNVNIAARLEAMTKERGCAVIVSTSVAHNSGLDFSALTTEDVPVRGRDEPVSVYTIGDVSRIPT